MEGTSDDWLYQLIKAFNTGNIKVYEETVKKYLTYISSNVFFSFKNNQIGCFKPEHKGTQRKDQNYGSTRAYFFFAKE